MDFNVSKCEVLTDTNKRSTIVTNYILHGQALKNVKSAKYLGITITNELKWNTHIDNIRAKANKTLGFVKRNVRTRQTPIKTKRHTRHLSGQPLITAPVCGIHIYLGESTEA